MTQGAFHMKQMGQVIFQVVCVFIFAGMLSAHVYHALRKVFGGSAHDKSASKHEPLP